MTPQEIIRLRLASQQLAASVCTKPEEVVARLGAMQAQEHGSAKWAIGARLQRAGAGATEAAIDGAVARRAIVRSWPMRGTIHYVAAADLRWMLALLTPRILAGTAERQKRLELDAAVFAQTRKRFSKWLKGGATLARTALLAALDQDGIPTAQNRGYHILWRHAQEGLICFGPHEGKEPTFALLDDWIPLSKSRALEGEAALEELAHRYFTGHGPATLDDFVWWSGLKVSDARRAIARAEKRLARIDGEQAEGRLTYWMAPEAATGKATRPPKSSSCPPSTSTSSATGTARPNSMRPMRRRSFRAATAFFSRCSWRRGGSWGRGKRR